MKHVIVCIICATVTFAVMARGQEITDSTVEGSLPAKQQKYSSTESVMAAVPQRLTYQGVLTGPSGAPVADGSYNFTVRLFDVPSGGTAAWTDNFTLPVDRGTFVAILGSGAALSLAFDKTYYLEVTVTGGPAGPSYPETLTPRTELTSAPYALAPWVPNGDNIYFNGGSVGLGTTAPGSNGIGALKMELADEDGLNSDIALRVAGQGAGDGSGVLNFAKSRGSLAAPAAAQHLDYMGSLLFLGHDGSSYQPGAGIGSQVIGTPGPGSIGGRLQFATRKIGDPGLFVRMTINSEGNVGIGTASPGYPVHIKTNNATPIYVENTPGTDGEMRFKTGSTSSLINFLNTDDSQAGYINSASNRLLLEGTSGAVLTSGTNVGVVVDGSGNVGVGTTSPTEQLHVYGGNNSGINIETPHNARIDFRQPGGDPDARTYRLVTNATQPGWFQIVASATSTGEPSEHRFNIDRDGLVGIGQAFPTSKLSVAGNIAVGTYNDVVGGAPTNGAIISGSVGIGTASPAYKLDVIGTVNATDDLNISLGKAYKIGGTPILSTPTTHTLVGRDVGISMTDATNNTAVGYQALKSTTSGSGNAAVGLNALTANTTGGANTAIGSQALEANIDGDWNSASGYRAMMNNTSGSYNTAAGVNALLSNTTGSFNSAFGNDALQQNTLGDGNTAVGISSMSHNDEGSENTAIGGSALGANTSGERNVASGVHALAMNTTGVRNTAAGWYAMESNTTGSANTVIGHYAMQSNTAGSYLTVVGNDAGVSADSLTNASAIGNGATVGASNTMVFGNASVIGWGFGVNAASGHAIEVGTGGTNGNGAYLTTGGTWTNTSDRNKKENFSSVDGGDLLEKIGQLPITMWNYKGENREVRHIGPMAQDFKRIFGVGNDDKSISTIDPSGIALAAIKELSARVEELESVKAELQQIRSALSSLDQENVRLKQANGLMIEAQSLNAARLARLETALLRLGLPKEALVNVSQKASQ